MNLSQALTGSGLNESTPPPLTTEDILHQAIDQAGGARIDGSGGGGGVPIDSYDEQAMLTHPLVNLLSASVGDSKPMTLRQQRVYVSSLETVAKLDKKTSVTVSEIAHKLECIKKINDMIAGDYRKSGGVAISTRFTQDRTTVEATDRRIGVRQGVTALTSDFSACDVSRLVERLCAAVMRYSQYKVMTFEMLSAGNTNIKNRDKVDGRIEEGAGTLYIPRVTARGGSSATWYAAVGGALGCGSNVVTDSTATDRNNRVVLSAPNGAELVLGCMEAVLRIWNNMAHCEAGVIASHAAAKGLHDEMSVVGHTDEGGFIRSVWRRNRFVVPYGVLWLDGERLASIPIPATVTPRSAARWCDAIAIYTAACSAMCDPMVEHGGQMYPSIFASGVTRDTVADYTEEGNLDAMATDHANKISSHSMTWCENMANCLDNMVSLKSSMEAKRVVAGFLQAGFDTLAGNVDRHLRHKTVAPFYWIEPQNVLGREIAKTDVQINGWGVFSFRGETREHPALEPGSKVLSDSNGLYANMYIPFTGARRNLLFTHLMNNPNDGLASILPRMTREDGLVLVGATDSNGGSFSERAAAFEDIGNFMWRHATCRLPAPAEFMQLEKGLAVRIVVGTMSKEGYYTKISTGSPQDYLGNIKCSGTQMVGLGVRNRSKPFTRSVVRTQSHAIASLQTNRGIVRGENPAFVELPISATGAMPGMNIVEEAMSDPRRLQVVGEEVNYRWDSIVGRVQDTVVCRGLRHRQVSRGEKKVMQTPGPAKEGGLQLEAFGDAPEESLNVVTSFIGALRAGYDPEAADPEAVFPRDDNDMIRFAEVNPAMIKDNLVKMDGRDSAELVSTIAALKKHTDRTVFESIGIGIQKENNCAEAVEWALMFFAAELADRMQAGIDVSTAFDDLLAEHTKEQDTDNDFLDELEEDDEETTF
uniref:Coat protein n=1 Tax=Diatom colony associated virus-Like RNA Segment 5 TaxID=1678185 RepID=A0A146J6L1_9VIRU|nr:coat protein [Diatom colony associated virus-Like RNA Segment 5]